MKQSQIQELLEKAKDFATELTSHNVIEKENEPPTA